MSQVAVFVNKNVRSISGLQKYLTPAILLGIILILSTALRFYDLGAESYWIDEMSTVIEAQQSIPELITSGRLDQPPAYYLPFHLWVQIFGTNEVSTRSFSALVGIGSILLIYLVGKELFGKTVGLLSAFFMAISGFQIYYSQIARFYSLFEFLTLLSFLFFILALREKKKIYFFLYGMASVLMIYSHTFGVFILAAQNVIFLFEWKKYKNFIGHWIICQMSILAVYLPYFYILVAGESGIGGAISLNVGKMPAPSVFEPLHSIYRFILPSRRLYGQEVTLFSAIAAGAFFIVCLLVYTLRQGKNHWTMATRTVLDNLREFPDLAEKLTLVFCWLACPILLPFIISILLVPVYKDYYTISAAPALYVLLAFGLYNLRKAVPFIISLSIVLILIVPGLGYYYSHDMNEQWQEAAAYVEKYSQPNDVIVFAPNENIGIQQKTFDWYYRGSLPACGLGVPLPDADVWKSLKLCISGHDRFWVIIRGTNDDLPHNRYTSFFLNPNQTAMHLIQEHHFVGVAVYLFELTNQ